MDRVEKIVLAFAAGLLGIFFGAACGRSFAGHRRSLVCRQKCGPSPKGVDTLPNGTRQIFYVARMWRFEPEVVEVPAGQPLDIFLSAADVTHGFYLSWSNANLMAIPGAVNAYRVRLDKPGVYPIVCHEYCGTAHQNMVAYLVVK